MNWSSPVVTTALQRLTIDPGTNEARAHRAQVVNVLQNELPVIPVAWYRQSAAVSKKLEGVALDPLERGLSVDRHALEKAVMPASVFLGSPGGRIAAQRFVQFVLVTLLVCSLVIVQQLPGDVAFRIAAGRYGYDYVTAEATGQCDRRGARSRPAGMVLVPRLGRSDTFR